jgi:acyl-CoA synthetase (AMP-forming)/AMP-acid ligase II
VPTTRWRPWSLQTWALPGRPAAEQVEIIGELPRTGLGKVAKLALRDKFSGS